MLDFEKPKLKLASAVLAKQKRPQKLYFSVFRETKLGYEKDYNQHSEHHVLTKTGENRERYLFSLTHTM